MPLIHRVNAIGVTAVRARTPTPIVKMLKKPNE
jgi:hypothetical protein